MKKKTKHLAFLGLALIGLVLCIGLFAGFIQAPEASATGLAFLPFAIGAVKVRDDMQKVRTVKYINTGTATTKDTIYLINSIPMLAMESALISVANIYLVIGLIEYAKLSAQAWTAGQKVYWDDGNGWFTTAASGNTLAGIAAEPAANPSATGLIILDPFMVGTNQLENVIADPGTGVAIPVTASGVMAITIGSAGAETNTLAAPARAGLTLVLTADVVGTGTRVVTCTTTVNQTGNNTMTFAAAGDTITLYSTQIGGAYRWRVQSNDGVALSTV